MIELFAFPSSPNSLKPVIVLEELGLDYKLSHINLRKGEQHGVHFKAMNPNGKVPVIVDRGITLAESGAILVYLAEMHSQLIPFDPSSRARVFEQLFFHASALSPAFLQAFFANIRKDASEEHKSNALKEVDRVLGVLETHLETRSFVAGDDYSIADIAHFGWLWRHDAVGVDFTNIPRVKRWYEMMSRRPTVISAIGKVSALSG